MEYSRRLQELERLLRESGQQIERERRRAEESERARREDQQRAERERQEAEQRAGRDRRELEQRAQRERQRAEESERARLEDQQRAERERQELEQRTLQGERRLRQEQEKNRPTTLDEYLTACHVSLFSNFTPETNPLLQSRGTITIPCQKWCPTTLRPWSDFLDRQRVIFGLLYATFPADARVFESRIVLDGKGGDLALRPIADEKGLEYFLHSSVENPVRRIFDQLKNIDEAKSAFSLGDGIVFENHPHAISDGAEEVVQNDIPSTPPATPDAMVDSNKLRPDQICVFRSDEAGSLRRTMLYVSEYKPPHKLTAPHLRLGLRGPIDIPADVINRKTIPTKADPDGKFQYDAEKLTASAITQTYHYMIEGGLEHGLLTTGEMIVFLHIDWNDPSTLLYHLAEPGSEVAAHPNESHLCTAVGQYLSFSLMALESSVHGQEERLRTMAGLVTWQEDFETTLRSIPEDERHAQESSPGYQPVTYVGVDRSPYYLRGKKRVPILEGPARELVSRGPREPPPDDDTAPDTPSPTVRRSARRTAANRRSQPTRTQQTQGGGGQDANNDMEYCTQKCLLGLVRGRLLDPACPNVALHRRDDGERPACLRHPLGHARFLELLWKQLQHSLDDGLTPLEHGGARGVLFRVTLLAHGYTFVAKGTVRAFVKHLEHEAAVYRRLAALQGTHVPVFLGAIDLRSMGKVYYFAHRVYVIHMTFLSWGGHGIGLANMGDEQSKELKTKALRSLRAIHGAGVVHKDVRVANMLLNEEVDGVMLLDFERALMVERPRYPLAQLVPSKRNWKPEAPISSKPADKSGRWRQVAKALAEDTCMMEYVFEQRCAY